MSYGGIGGQGLTVSQGSQALVVLAIPNNITSGTVTNQLACWDGSGNATNCPITLPAKVIGLVFMNGGTGGTAAIVRMGTAPCVFDTGSTPAVGDYVVPSSTNPGYCHDAGSNYPVGYQPVGTVTNLGVSGINYIFVTNDGLALSPGSSGNMTITGGTGSQATIDIVSNPVFGTSVTSPVFNTPAAAASSPTAAITISTGANTGSGGTGGVTIDAGNPSAGTGGAIQIGSTYAHSVSLGNASATSTVNGPLQVNGTATVGVSGSSNGRILLANTSGASVTLATTSGLITNWTMALPTSGGTSGYLLQTNGSGTTSWVAPGTGAIIALGTSPTAANPEISGAPSYGFYTTGSNDIDVAIGGSKTVSWTSNGQTIQGNATMSAPSAATLQFGGPDATAPVAQTLQVQNASGASNTAGTSLIINGSRGTGTGAGGSILFQTAPAGVAGSSQNALLTAMTISGGGGVGVGTATPALPFEVHVTNAGESSDFLLQNDSTDSSANVGTGVIIRRAYAGAPGGFYNVGGLHGFTTGSAMPPLPGIGALSLWAGLFDGTTERIVDLITLSNSSVGIGPGLQPTSVSMGAGATPAPVLVVSGTAGGNTTATSSNAGAGAAVMISAGNGGTAPIGSANGNGGSIVLTPGVTGAGPGTSGSAGVINLNGNAKISLGFEYGCTHGTNATCGVSALSGGTVTVSTAAISTLAASGSAGAAVSLTLQSCSSCGALSIGSVTAGTSFVINSTNASDASKVFWEIKTIN
jgi:hypothetical protein